MVDFSDIVPSTEAATIRGREVEVIGLDLLAIVKLGQRFPDLAKLLNGFQLDAFLKQPREVIGAVLAAGIGQAGDEGTERGLGNLKFGEQAALGAAILRQTGGLVPFVELLNAASGAVPGPRAAADSDGIKVRLVRRSPQASVG